MGLQISVVEWADVEGGEEAWRKATLKKRKFYSEALSIFQSKSRRDRALFII